MLNGYCLIARDYKAEIVEFATLSIITMPDSSKLYLIHTKYGDEYRKENELSTSRETFEKECKELNAAFERAQEGGEFGDRRIYQPRQHW